MVPASESILEVLAKDPTLITTLNKSSTEEQLRQAHERLLQLADGVNPTGFLQRLQLYRVEAHGR